MVPISLSIHGELLHHHLRHYKDNPRPSVRVRYSTECCPCMWAALSTGER